MVCTAHGADWKEQAVQAVQPLLTPPHVFLLVGAVGLKVSLIHDKKAKEAIGKEQGKMNQALGKLTSSILAFEAVYLTLGGAYRLVRG